MKLIVTGGAPLARHVEDFLKVTMCCPVVQGYGLTETCAASFIAIPDQAVSLQKMWLPGTTARAVLSGGSLVLSVSPLRGL